MTATIHTLTLPLPYTGTGSSPWASDKTTARTRGFLSRHIALGLAAPAAVTDAVAAFTTATTWATTVAPDARNARAQYRLDLLAAARTGAAEPDRAHVIAALTRADATSMVGQDLAAVSETLHMELMTTVTAHLDAMTDTIVAEHDRLMTDAKTQADRLPASVQSADDAVAAGPDTAAAWLALSHIGDRLMKVRDLRVRAASLDGTRHSIDYALYRRPDRFPKGDPAPVNDALKVLDLIVDRHGVEPWCPARDELAHHVETERAATARRRQGPESTRGRYVSPPMWNKP